MAKLPPIRIRKRDEEEYRRLQRNTKAKINRVKKNYGVDLEGEIPLPDLSEFQTRKEFNEWKELQSSFTNRANTEYQRSEERRVGKECRTRREPAYDKKKRNRKE